MTQYKENVIVADDAASVCPYLSCARMPSAPSTSAVRATSDRDNWSSLACEARHWLARSSRSLHTCAESHTKWKQTIK